MAQEIERKYLLDPAVLAHPTLHKYKADNIIQAYLCRDVFDIRARITNDDFGSFCIKHGKGVVRNEYEYEVPVTDAEEIIAVCGNMVQKKRYYIVDGGSSNHIFELDEYFANNAGLVTLEVELLGETELIVFPDWLASFVVEEVTGNKKYSNSTLAYN